MIIFVFGANREGRHGKGAALHAVKYHGAIYGQTGLMVNLEKGIGCYGVITKELRHGYPPVTLEEVSTEINKLIECALMNPQHTFHCTPFGTGLAGFTHGDMIGLLNQKLIPINILLPKEWSE